MADDEEQAYHPNMLEKSEGGSPGPNEGPACYRDQFRICGPDCMAYLPQVPDGSVYVGEQWAHCLLLVSHERSGRHLVVLADTLTKHAAFQRGQRAEAIRNEKAPEAR